MKPDWDKQPGLEELRRVLVLILAVGSEGILRFCKRGCEGDDRKFRLVGCKTVYSLF